MEFELSLNWFLFLSFLIIMGWKWKKSKSGNNYKIPPGPMKLPIIGNVHQLLKIGIIHQGLSKLGQKYGPIIYLQLGEIPTVVVSCRNIAREILEKHDPAFANRPNRMTGKIVFYNNTDIALSSYDQYWKQMRKIIVKEFVSPNKVRSFEYIRHDEVKRLMEMIKNSAGVSPAAAAVNLTELISYHLSSVTCRVLFGQVFKDKFTLIKLLKLVIELSSGFDLVDVFPSIKLFKYFSLSKRELVKVHGKVDVILDDIIKEHRKNRAISKNGNGEFGNEDLIDIFLRLMESGALKIPITDDNIKAIIFEMFLVGTETTSSTLEWTMAELMRNPDVMSKAQAEVRECFKGKKIITKSDIHKLKYLKLVIKETLRLHPPLALVPRACREECVVEGYTITDKTQTFINLWAIGRDPTYWNDPLEYQPHRFDGNDTNFIGQNYEYIPFGLGRRRCPGISFGIANIELPLAYFLYYFNWQIPEGIRPNDLDMTERNGATNCRMNKLWAIATPFDLSLFD